MVTGPQDLEDPVQHFAHVHQAEPPAVPGRCVISAQSDRLGNEDRFDPPRCGIQASTSVAPQRDKESHPTHSTQEVSGSALSGGSHIKPRHESDHKRAARPEASRARSAEAGQKRAWDLARDVTLHSGTEFKVTSDTASPTELGRHCNPSPKTPRSWQPYDRSTITKC